MKLKTAYAEYDVFPRVRKYGDGNTKVALLSLGGSDSFFGEPVADLTVNIASLPEGFAAIDINNFPEAADFIKEYGLGKPTTYEIPSGYVSYPIYCLDINKIKDLEKEGENTAKNK